MLEIEDRENTIADCEHYLTKKDTDKSYLYRRKNIANIELKLLKEILKRETNIK